MYDFKSRVRYSEVNSERQLTLPGTDRLSAELLHISVRRYEYRCGVFRTASCCVGVIVLGDRHEPLSKACGAYYGEHLAI